jgi:hypothetical protein
VGGLNRLAVELGEEDVGDGVVDAFGRGLEEVREADVEDALAQADGGIEGGEATETDVQSGDGSAGPQLAVLVLEDGNQRGGHDGFRLTCGASESASQRSFEEIPPSPVNCAKSSKHET